MAGATLAPDRVDALLAPLLDDGDPAVRLTAGLCLVRRDRHADDVVRMFVETLLADPGIDHPEQLQWGDELIVELHRDRPAAISTLVSGFAALAELEGTETEISLSYGSPPGEHYVRAILAALGPQAHLLLIDEMLEGDLKRRHVSARLLRRIERLSPAATERLRGLKSHAVFGVHASMLLDE